MRKVLFLAVALFVLMAGVAHAELKIGVVDTQLIATESEPAKDARKKMDAKYGAEKKKLDEEAATLQKKSAELQKNPTEAKQVEFIKLKRQFDEKQYTFARKVEQDNVKTSQDIIALVFQASYEVARQKGFNFVVDLTAGGVLYGEDNMDLTKDVMAEVNKLWKAGANKEKK